jgi:hypothetical protein
VSSAFELEEAASRSKLSDLLRSSRKDNQAWIETVKSHSSLRCISLTVLQYIMCAFLLDEPLLSLPEEVFTQYQSQFLRCARIDTESLL